MKQVPGQTGGSGAKTRWKREAYCYTPAQAPGGTVATWTSVPGAGFEADHAPERLNRSHCALPRGWYGVVRVFLIPQSSHRDIPAQVRILIAAPGFVGGRCGEQGQQVGRVNEESQVRGCYNITFICTNQERDSVGSPLNQMHRQQLELLLTDDLLLQGHWGKRDAAGPAHKF